MSRKQKTGLSVGSLVSSKQIAYASVAGRKVTFFTSGREVCGYVVAMDDFHWMVAESDPFVVRQGVEGHVRLPSGGDALTRLAGDPKAEPEQPVIRKYLVHKVGTLVMLHDEATLDQESPPVRVAIEEIGRSFFHLANRLYLGQPIDDDEPPPPLPEGRQITTRPSTEELVSA